MKQFGPLENNLFAAIRSAKRIRGHPVHPTTFAHWGGLLHEARELLRNRESIEVRDTLEGLISQLEHEIEHVRAT